MENIDLFSINMLWGNLTFDHAVSSSVGISRGIFCVWDSNLFIKDHVSSSDYFLAIMGTWTPSSTKHLVISVYAPQEVTEKRALWDYLRSLIDRWNGEIVVLGDCNEVRTEQEWFGSTFNIQGANSFNNFISIAGLIDHPLGGYSYTWVHKSASKMSKLDRFLISEGLMELFPHLTGLCLDRHLSNHRPIIMVESKLDYGPIPFRIFHSWFKMEGFDKFVEDTWNSLKVTDSNALICMKKKLQLLKHAIKDWQAEELERIISFDEIKNAVWDCDTNKSPGPNGFTFDFFQKYWNIIGHDIVAAVSQFFVTGKFPPGCNSTFIALIPKIHDAKVVRDFRPISLIGSIYKIVAKILANRLSVVIPDLISEVQTAFVSNRQILDGSFILKELISWRKHKKLKAMIFKVDFENAFDSVRWDYLDDILKSFGFGNKWRGWISGCLNSAKGPVLITGSPTSEFQFHKGEWVISNIKMIVNVLNCFFMASGLKINLHKSKLSGIGISKEDTDLAASIVGCSTCSLPFHYLGVKVGASVSRINSWKEVIDKISSRLSKWKTKTLSNGGRLTLLKSVLTSLPIYYMSIYKTPSAVIKDLEAMRRDFFIGSDKADKKMVWIRWDITLASKNNGGLGVSSFFATNQALLFKWIWRFLTQCLSFWSNLIKAINGVKGSIDTPKAKISGSIWQEMVREFSLLKSKGIDCFSFIKRKLGNGENTLFWEDNWLADSALKASHPRLFALETDKGVNVADKLSHASLAFSFRRIPRSGAEHEQYKSLISITSDVILPQMQDRWSWTLNGSGDFTVSLVRNYIDDIILPKMDAPTRWVNLIPIKINILAWKISMDRLPTRFNLSSCGLEIPSILCPLCNEAAETTTHTFSPTL
ncbi:RNA-directed DNA polymerase, eukaryota [Tanacetum coccineum]